MITEDLILQYFLQQVISFKDSSRRNNSILQLFNSIVPQVPSTTLTGMNIP